LAGLLLLLQAASLSSSSPQRCNAVVDQEAEAEGIWARAGGPRRTRRRPLRAMRPTPASAVRPAALNPLERERSRAPRDDPEGTVARAASGTRAQWERSRRIAGERDRGGGRHRAGRRSSANESRGGAVVVVEMRRRLLWRWAQGEDKGGREIQLERIQANSSEFNCFFGSGSPTQVTGIS